MPMLLLLALAAQDASKYWDFPAGTQWTYVEKVKKGTEETESKRTVMTVKGKKDGKLQIDSQEFADPKSTTPSKTEKLVMYFDAKEKVVVWGKIGEGDKETVDFHPYKVGADTWTSPMGGPEAQCTIKRTGNKKKYKFGSQEFEAECFSYEIDAGGEEKIQGSYCYAAGVGMLHMEMSMGELGTFSFSLAEFSQGK